MGGDEWNLNLCKQEGEGTGLSPSRKHLRDSPGLEK